MSPLATFLLTEIVGSARLWDEDESAMVAATARLDGIVRDAIAAHGGTQVKPRGEGDSHFLTFDDPADAIACSVALQRAVAGEPSLSLRSACHVGEAELRGGDWYGTTVNRCARLRAAAHARQSLASAEVAAAVAAAGTLPEGVSLRSLGRHRLKDLDEPTEVFQICADGLAGEHPPLPTLARAHGLPIPRSSFVGRDRELARAAEVLARGGMVTVAGPPGVGTTRFALEAAAAWWQADRGPVRLVVGPSTGLDGARSAGELMVADDVDDVLVDLVTARAAGTDVPGPAVVTMRTPAAVALAAQHPASHIRLAPLDTFDSEHLLRDRLGDDLGLPAGAVEHCDGLPLAIELLARRAATVAPDQLIARLGSDPLGVLGGDRRADPARHASVRATLQAAFDRLTAAERDALLAAEPGDARWVEAGWHEPGGPLPIVAAFLRDAGRV